MNARAYGQDSRLINVVPLAQMSAKPRISTSSNVPVELHDEFFIRQSKKVEDDLKELGTKIKHYEDNINYLRGQKNKIEESILDMQVAIGKYHTASLSKRENKEPSSVDTEEVENDILMLQTSEEKSRLKAQVSDQHWAEDVIGTVSSLGKVDNVDLSRLLSEYLGLETMQAIVCKSYKRLKPLESCVKDGLESKALPIVIFLDKLRPYTGETIAGDPQRRLDLLKPKMPNGETPYGFLGFAVNMIHINEADLYYYASTTRYSLRDTLFYNLFSNSQVYRSRDDMLKAIPYIPNGAISLDGGIMKNSATFYLGYPRRDITVKFPVSSKSGNLPESYFATENRLKELKWKKNQVMEDFQREQAQLNLAKFSFETKKSELLDLAVSRSPLAPQVGRSSTPRSFF